MLPYYVLMLMPMAVAIYSSRGKIGIESANKTKDSRRAFILFFGFFIILLSLRSLECGVDLKAYQYYYNVDLDIPLESIPQRYSIEVGFHLFNKIVSIINNNFQVYLALVAIICITPLLVIYISDSDLPLLSIALFVVIAPFSLYFSGIRQSLALAFAPLSLYAAKKKKIWVFILSVFLSVLFHQSGIILAVLYPLYGAKIKKNWLYLVIPIMGIVLVFNSRIYSLMATFFGERYLGRYGEVSSTGAYTTIILMLMLSVYSIIMPDNEKIDVDTLGYRNILFFSTCLQCFAPVNSIAMRMNYYYLIFVPIAISRVITRSKESLKSTALLSYCVLIMVFYVYFFYNAYTGADVLQVFPYVPFWK